MQKFFSLSKTLAAFLIGVGMFTSVHASAQNRIHGVVADETGPLPGVTVLQVGTTNGALTDSDGRFSLEVPEGAQIRVSSIGYLTEVLTVGKSSIFDILLKEDSQVLNEVVVTGYGGTQRRAKLTNSIAKVDEKTFSIGSFTNPASALSGAVSGLRVIQSSGNPTSVPSIILRGGTNLDGSGSPLVIVDGQLRDSMEDINPEDIESMDVLKDAGATALYGARASNGVVLITTKSGKEGSRGRSTSRRNWASIISIFPGNMKMRGTTSIGCARPMPSRIGRLRPACPATRHSVSGRPNSSREQCGTS